MQEVGEIGWQLHMLHITVELYLSSLFGSPQKCLALKRGSCISAAWILVWNQCEEAALNLSKGVK